MLMRNLIESGNIVFCIDEMNYQAIKNAHKSFQKSVVTKGILVFKCFPSTRLPPFFSKMEQFFLCAEKCLFRRNVGIYIFFCLVFD